MHLQFTSSLALVLVFISTGVWAAESGGADVVWSLGKKDGSSIEFAPGSRSELTFRVGESKLASDFAGHHSGTVGFDSDASGEKPYTIEFDLDDDPAAFYRLVLDLVFRMGSPTKIRIEINGKGGIFPVDPEPVKANDSADANSLLWTRQTLVAPLPSRCLRKGTNRLTIVPLGFGFMDYDALRLERTEDQSEAFWAGSSCRQYSTSGKPSGS